MVRKVTGAPRVLVFDHTIRTRAPGRPPLGTGRSRGRDEGTRGDEVTIRLRVEAAREAP